MRQGKRNLTMLLLMLLCVFCVKGNASAYIMDDGITVTNLTYTSATIDWSGVGSYVANTLSPGARITGYDVYLGETLVSTGSGTSVHLPSIASGTMHFIFVYVNYVDIYGYSEQYYTFDYFETGDNANINDGGQDNGTVTPSPAPTPTPTPSPTPSATVSLTTPTVSKAELGDGTLALLASNVDSNAYKIEWQVYDKKTGKCVATDDSYSTDTYIYSFNGRKVYYAICRVVGYDSNYNDVYSSWSAKKYFVSQPKVTSTKKHIKKNSITIKWKKVTGAKNYTVYAKKKNAKKWVKIKTTSKTSYKLTKLKGKRINTYATDYAFRVVTNAKVGGKTIKSGTYESYYTYTY
ncbi:MAG: hypothetical protein IJP29_05180 [Lachnospiraceae bacterium]|nr:hypothetical protein [Lachnospiraceae bacterium]